MYNYADMPTTVLVDLLAQETEKITQLLVDKQFNDQYEASKNIIKQIQAVIEVRKETTISDPNISFTQPDSTV